jgi:hypothetical protein
MLTGVAIQITTPVNIAYPVARITMREVRWRSCALMPAKRYGEEHRGERVVVGALDVGSDLPR